MIPTYFQGARVLRALNVLAVGFSLAAIATILLRGLVPALYIGVSTLFFGLLWASVLRLRKTIAGTSLRWGWLASVPLAALNAAVVCGLLMVSLKVGGWSVTLLDIGLGAFTGATSGAIIWIPALALTLLCFGVPIAWSQRLAAKGLAGEERGERIIGGVSASLSLLALMLSLSAKPPVSDGLIGIGAWFVRASAIAGALSGGAAALLAQGREARRRAFVARAEAGDLQGFRVEASPEGKVLVRVWSRGQGYRVADFHEEVCLLDEEGRAVR